MRIARTKQDLEACTRAHARPAGAGGEGRAICVSLERALETQHEPVAMRRVCIWHMEYRSTGSFASSPDGLVARRTLLRRTRLLASPKFRRRANVLPSEPRLVPAFTLASVHRPIHPCKRAREKTTEGAAVSIRFPHSSASQKPLHNQQHITASPRYSTSAPLSCT